MQRCQPVRLTMRVRGAARSLGLRVPQDLSVVGFDNIRATLHLDVTGRRRRVGRDRQLARDIEMED